MLWWMSTSCGVVHLEKKLIHSPSFCTLVSPHSQSIWTLQSLILKKRLKNGEMSLLCANLSDDSSPSALFKWLCCVCCSALFAALFFAFWSMYSLCRSLSHCCHTTCVWGWFMAKVLSMHCYGDFRARTARLQNGRGWKGHQEIIKSSPLLTQVPYSRSHR